MRTIDLSVNLANGLTLDDPFWVASCHFSDQPMLKIWKDIRPAAITLKTATRMDTKEDKGRIKRKTLEILPRYGRSYYSDAPKSEELYPYEEIKKHLETAKELLPKSKVGVSVLASEKENFADLRLMTEAADFWELNLKYSMRVSTAGNNFFDETLTNWSKTLALINQFLQAFAAQPVFVKLSRELSWLPQTAQCRELICHLKNHGRAGLVVANSRKIDVAEFVHEGEEQSLKGGIITGDFLFDDTIKLLEAFKNDCKENKIALVASGGMVDEQQILMAIRQGADAVQLCTAFEYYKPGYYRTLVSALNSRVRWRGHTKLSQFVDRLRGEGVASIYSMPFFYYSTFWGDDAQKALKVDMKYSDRMDAVVMSGYTLLEEWKKDLESRVRDGKSIRIMLPNPDAAIFRAIQNSWGLVDQEFEARQKRIRATKENFERLFAQESPPEGEKENIRSVGYYAQCPFYSFYLFDDKVYLAQYPFLRPGRLASPVYVFSRSSPEYDRLDSEWHELEALAKQTLVPGQ